MLDTPLQILQTSILAVIFLKLLTSFDQQNETPFRDSRKDQTIETLNATLSEKELELYELLVEKEELTKFLYIQIDDLEARELDGPATVCTLKKCTEVIKVQGETKMNYKTHCHIGCDELDGVGTVNIGHANMKRCVVMNHTTGNCVKCGCSSVLHRRIAFKNFLVKRTVVDENTAKQIKTKKEAIDLVQDHIDKLLFIVAEQRKSAYSFIIIQFGHKSDTYN